jgi:hypothetical protein
LAERLNDGKGGYNKETILLTVETLNLFCLKAGTEKANQINRRK